VRMCALFDNEEIGSASVMGAASAFMPSGQCTLQFLSSSGFCPPSALIWLILLTLAYPPSAEASPRRRRIDFRACHAQVHVDFRCVSAKSPVPFCLSQSF